MNQFYEFKIGLNRQFIQFPEPWAQIKCRLLTGTYILQGNHIGSAVA